MRNVPFRNRTGRYNYENKTLVIGFGVSYMYGVGAEYFLLDNISVGASYQSFGVDINGDSDNLSSFTGNVTFHFL